MEIIYRMSAGEIEQDMRLVGETYKLGSGKTNTMRGRRLFDEIVPAKYIERARDIVNDCKYVYSHGMRQPRDFTVEDIAVLKYLVEYCMKL